MRARVLRDQARVRLSLLFAIAWTACRREPPLPDLGAVPPFHLRDQRDRPFGLEDLRGKVWIANFMFTSCTTFCPVLTAQMADLQGKLGQGDRIHFVSLSVDPMRDSPHALSAYAKRMKAAHKNWTFLTGPPDEIHDVITKGFHMAIGTRVPRSQGTYDILHSRHFVLVDPKGHIRGYYATDKQGLERLRNDAPRLLANHS